MNATLNSVGLEKLRNLILKRTGLAFGRRSNDLLSLELMAKAEKAGCKDMHEFYGRLQESRPDSELWESLLKIITVGETYFFRDPVQFDALRQNILPDLISLRRSDRRLRIWSAGCATGEEPYSIAILLREILPDVDDWNICILATDINKQFLRKASEGCYKKWSFRGVDPTIQKRYFSQQDQCFKLCSDVSKMVSFAYLNLINDSYPSLPTNTNAMDLILCRNVTIYMPEKQIRKNAKKFYRCLMPDGLLIVSAVEIDSNVYNQFQTCNINGAFVYRKVDGPHVRADRPVPKPAAKPLPGLLKKVRPRRERINRSVVINNLYQDGFGHAQQGRFNEAMACFQCHLKHNPNSARTCCQIARLNANAGLLKGARQYALKSIKLDPLLIEAYYTLALIHQEELEIDMAIEHFKKALYLDSDFVLAHFNLASLYQKLNRHKEAARHRNQVIRILTRIPPEEEIPGSDGLTGAQLISMVNTYYRKKG